jgi:hypothetical protein
MSVIALALIALGPSANAESVPAARGIYIGPFETSWDLDGRHLILLKKVVYVDLDGVRWEVPEGVKIDGASIPQVLWSIVGGPFEGKYREASVIHDYYCDVRLRPWKDVAKVFYQAMITSGVDTVKAKLMYLAVVYGGPRWDEQAIYNTRLAAKTRGKDGRPEVVATEADPPLSDAALDALGDSAFAEQQAMLKAGPKPPPKFSEGTLKTLADQVASKDLSLDQIDALADAARANSS